MNVNGTMSVQNIEFNNADFKINVCKKEAIGVKKNFHEAIEIKYLYQGNSAVMIDGEVFLAKEGDVVVVNPYEIHTNVNIEKYNGKYYMIIVAIDFLTENNEKGIDLRNEMLALGKKFVNRIENNAVLRDIIVRVFSEMSEQKPYYKTVVVGLISEFFALLFRDYVNKSKSRDGKGAIYKNADLIAPALSKIFREYNKELTIEELSKECNISKYHFCRVFKNTFSTSFYKYLTNIRIQKAKSLLSDSQMSVAEIAEKVGYVNGYCHFFETFKKQVGMTPLEFRKNWEKAKRGAENQNYILYPNKTKKDKVRHENE